MSLPWNLARLDDPETYTYNEQMDISGTHTITIELQEPKWSIVHKRYLMNYFLRLNGETHHKIYPAQKDTPGFQEEVFEELEKIFKNK